MVFFTAMRGGPAAARYAEWGLEPRLVWTLGQAESLKRGFMAPLQRERGIHPLELVKQIQNAIVPLGYCMYKSKERLEEALGMVLDVKATDPRLEGDGLSPPCGLQRSPIHGP